VKASSSQSRQQYRGRRWAYIIANNDHDVAGYLESTHSTQKLISRYIIHFGESSDKTITVCQLLTVADRPQSKKINCDSGDTIVNEGLRIGLVIASCKPCQIGKMSFIDR